jgi:hypothetical protein
MKYSIVRRQNDYFVYSLSHDYSKYSSVTCSPRSHPKRSLHEHSICDQSQQSWLHKTIRRINGLSTAVSGQS